MYQASSYLVHQLGRIFSRGNTGSFLSARYQARLGCLSRDAYLLGYCSAGMLARRDGDTTDADPPSFQPSRQQQLRTPGDAEAPGRSLPLCGVCSPSFTAAAQRRLPGSGRRSGAARPPPPRHRRAAAPRLGQLPASAPPRVSARPEPCVPFPQPSSRGGGDWSRRSATSRPRSGRPLPGPAAALVWRHWEVQTQPGSTRPPALTRSLLLPELPQGQGAEDSEG